MEQVSLSFKRLLNEYVTSRIDSYIVSPTLGDSVGVIRSIILARQVIVDK